MSKGHKGKKIEERKRNGAVRYLTFEWREFQKAVSPERCDAAARILLALWALLPAFAFAAYVWAWIRYGGAAPQSEVGNSFVYRGALAYAHMYYVLGALTGALVLLRTLAHPPSVSRLSRIVRLEPWNGCLSLLLLWSVLGTLLSASPGTQLTGVPLQFDGLVSYLIWAALYLCALSLPGEDRLPVLRIFTGAATFCTFLLFGQIWHWPVIYDVLFRVPSSVFFNQNHFAYYLCTSVLVLAGLFLFDRGRRRTIWYACALVLQIYGLILSDTFGSYLAVLFALPFLYLYYWRHEGRPALWTILPAAAFVLVSVLCAVGLLPNGGSSLLRDLSTTSSEIGELVSGETEFAGNTGGSGRITHWKAALELLPRAPILGFGPAGMPADYAGGTTRPHNAFLQIALFHGIPGLILYVAALISLFLRQWKKLGELGPAALVAAGGVGCYLISSFFGVPMFYTSPYLFLLLGFAAEREPGHPLGEDA